MRYIPIIIAVAVTCLAILWATSDASAHGFAPGNCHGHSASHSGPHHAGHVYVIPQPVHGGYLTPSPKPSFAYGWFGVKPRRHKGVHYGYYNNYTQWSNR